MTTSQNHSSLSRIELVVLACLSQAKPPSEAVLGKAVHDLCLPGESLARGLAVASETIAVLRRRMLVSGDRRVLTDAGAGALRAELRLAHTPTWSEVRGTHLPALALGLAPGSEAARVVADQATIVPAILSARFGVRDASTLVELCDALIAEAVGMAPVPVKQEQLRAHVLARRAGIDARGKLEAIATRAAKAAVGAGPSARGAITKALTGHWARGKSDPAGVALSYTPCRWPAPQAPYPVSPEPARSASEEATQAGYPASDARPAERPLPRVLASELKVVPAAPRSTVGEALLDVVRETIPRVGADGRFGSEKVFVSAIWRSLEHDRRLADLSFDRFKRWLVSANRDGWLVLARADLIGAMDAKQVAESAIEDRGATFHFVLDQRINAPASRRDSHAR